MCAYGLTDASRGCYETVCVLIERLGYDRVEADYRLFLRVVDGTFQFRLAADVDELLYGGSSAEVRRSELELQASFFVGPIAVGNLTFTGLRLRCSDDAVSGQLMALVGHDHYLEAIEEIDVPADRVAGTAAAVTTLELTLYRRAVGALLWASGQTQPFIACTSSIFARRFDQAVVRDLLGITRVIRAAKAARGLPLCM